VKYAWVEEHRTYWPVAVMCDVLKVSRSGFYSWRRRQKSPTVLTPTAKKRCERFAVIEEVFQKSRGIFVVVILDLFSRKVIGYATADHMRTELVVSALKMALMRGRKLLGDIWLHSDRGVQFASEQFRDALQLANIEQSMSRQGNCWDNAPCESWFGKLKSEWIYPHGVYATRKEAELSIIEYIEMFYNSERVHQALNYQTPNEFEAKYFDAQITLTPMSLDVTVEVK
jgi:putative transposase